MQTKTVHDVTTGQALLKLGAPTEAVTTTGTASVFDTWGRATAFTIDAVT